DFSDRRKRQVQGRGGAGGHGGIGRNGARGAHRNGRGGRRTTDGEVLRGRDVDRRRIGGRYADGDTDGQAVPAGLHVGHREHRRATTARRRPEHSAVAGRSAVQGPGERRQRRGAQG